MSIIPLSFRVKKRLLRVSFSLLAATSTFFFLSLPSGAKAEGDYERLWNAAAKDGQWRAFGLGVLDSRALPNEGVSLDVNWSASTFGAGVSYEARESDGLPLPSLASYRTVRFEARAIGEDARTVTLEFVIRAESQSGKEKAYRAVESSAKTIAGEWSPVEFEIAADFPGIEVRLDEINALRILFLKGESGGRGRVEFRNVELVK